MKKNRINVDYWITERAIIASSENFQNRNFALHSVSHLSRVESVSVLKHYEMFRWTTKYSNGTIAYIANQKNILKINS